MPEAPEIQAHAERMTSALEGKTLIKFELLSFASLKTVSPRPDDVVGSRLTAVERRGKCLIMKFDNDQAHLVHLMQGGRLRPDAKRSRKPRNGLARWVFNDTAWLLTEAGTERKAGVWAVDGDPLSQDPIGHLGLEVDQVDQVQLDAILREHSKRLHGVLRDQRLIAGLGRMLANEICFEARLSPFANTSKLTSEQRVDLLEAILEVTRRSTAHERTLEDIGKSIDRPSKVHNRQDKPCVDCDDVIRAVKYRKYTVYYCASHQTSGKLLADNTTSKFLK